MTAALSCRQLACVFGGVVALDDVDLEVGEGEWVSIVGANAAGKTTLLNAVSGLATLKRGRVQISGRDVTNWPFAERARRAGLVRTFEGMLAAPRLTAVQNIVAAIPSGGRTAVHLAATWLDRVGLGAQRDRPAEDLSLGQQRRLSLAAAGARRDLVGPRAMVLLDEPFRGLDAAARDIVCELLTNHFRQGTAVLLVEHDVERARQLGHRTLRAEAGRLAPLRDTPAALDPPQPTPAVGAVAVDVRNLVAGYGGVEVLADLSFVVGSGEAVQLTGPNGCGKSTLIRVLTGSLQPRSGAVHVAGRALGTGAVLRSHRIAYVPQGARVVPGLSVRAHLELVEPRGEGASVEAEFRRGVPEAAGLDGDAASLSAGQRAMLAIRLALRSDPAILLADEPGAALAPSTRARFYDFLLHHWLRSDRCLIFVEHGPLRAGCREVRLQGGRIEAT